MGKLFEFLTDWLSSEKPEPHLAISLKRLEATADPLDQTGQSRVTWKMKLLLQNESDSYAAEIKLVWPRDGRLFEAQFPYHLDQFQDKAAIFQVERTLALETVGSGGTPEQLWELLPAEFRKMTLVLSYRSQRGETFYTIYSLDEGAEECEFTKIPPE